MGTWEKGPNWPRVLGFWHLALWFFRSLGSVSRSLSGVLGSCPSPLFSVLSLVRILLNPLAPLRLRGGSQRGSQSLWPSHSDVPMSRATTCTTPNQTSLETAALLNKKPFLIFRDPQTRQPALCLTCALPVTRRKEPGSPLHRGG